jgi:hypothetical protein
LLYLHNDFRCHSPTQGHFPLVDLHQDRPAEWRDAYDPYAIPGEDTVLPKRGSQARADAIPTEQK